MTKPDTHAPAAQLTGVDNQPRYTTKRLRDEVAKAKEYARREALEEAAKIAEHHAEILGYADEGPSRFIAKDIRALATSEGSDNG